MGKILTDAVTPADDGTWTFTCPVNAGCGSTDETGHTGFTSGQWPTRKTAEARGQEHFDEHKGIAPMSSLEDFRIAHNLQADAEGVVTVKDL